MKISDDTKKQIEIKSKKLGDLKIHLKDEFVGLDDIIDDVINSLTPFYIFPETLTRPIVVNLWGMTGTGKTSLVEKIVDFLKLNNSYIKFDIGEHNGDDKSLRIDLSSKIKKVKGSSSIILFDEFQLGRTIDESGREINKNGLRPLWELLDSGIIYTYNSRVYVELIDLIDKIRKCIKMGVVIDNEGYVSKHADIYDSIFGDEYGYRPIDYKECSLTEEDDDGKKIAVKSNSTLNYYDEKEHFKTPKFIKYSMFHHTLYPANPDIFDGIKNLEFHQKKFYCTFPKLMEFLEEELLLNMAILSKKDYSKSIIFCLGNLDEVYHMSHNVNPDEDADLFHENSLKITLPEIKNALSSRFRMEQIGRLGNNHFIYPSLSKKSYETLIVKFLDKKINYLKEEFDLDAEFDESVYDILYKEGVYPTQGTRPLLSTFNTMIDSYVTKILTDLSLKKPKTTKIEWSYENDLYIIKTTEKSKIQEIEYPVKCILEKLRKIDDSEMQTMVATHESGHALISCIKMRLAPLEILSKTANLSEGLCRYDYNDIVQTKDFLYNRIMVSLGGIEAERLIFGDDMVSNGSYSDLEKATSNAFNMVKSFGMDKYDFLVSADSETDGTVVYVKDEKVEHRVKDLLEKAKQEVIDCLKTNKKALLILSSYLIENPKIKKAKIKELLSDMNIEWKDNKTYYSFKDKFSKHIENVDYVEVKTEA